MTHKNHMLPFPKKDADLFIRNDNYLTDLLLENYIPTGSLTSSTADLKHGPHESMNRGERAVCHITPKLWHLSFKTDL